MNNELEKILIKYAVMYYIKYYIQRNSKLLLHINILITGKEMIYVSSSNKCYSSFDLMIMLIYLPQNFLTIT